MSQLEENIASLGGQPAEETIPEIQEEEIGLLHQTVNEIINSPLNLVLVLIIGILIYKIIKGRYDVPKPRPEEPKLPKLRRDFTVQDLKKYDGHQEDGRVLVAVNGSVYDVTKGKRFYGPGGPYQAFGGRDASRCLATFSVTVNDKDDYDDLSDLSTMEMDSVKEWEMQFKEKYELVGKLLKPGEQPTNYSDEDEDTSAEKPTEEIGDICSEGQETEIRKRINVSEE